MQKVFIVLGMYSTHAPHCVNIYTYEIKILIKEDDFADNEYSQCESTKERREQ